jgi:hypothetical protein
MRQTLLSAVNIQAARLDRAFTPFEIFCEKTSTSKNVEIIEIPFEPDAAKEWSVHIPGDGFKHFSSRDEAIAFAFKLVNSEKLAQREGFVCIEGGDGHWRVFTSDQLPAKRVL